MTNEPKLRQQLAHHEYLREQLTLQFPVLHEDEQTLADTLEGMTDLTDMLAELIRSSLDDKAFAEVLKLRMGDMSERLARFATRAQRKRDLAWELMERADIRKIAEPDFTASLRASRPKVMVTDESKIPQRYWLPQPAKLDRAGLHTTLSAGGDVPGANLSNTPSTISVRTK